MTAPSSLYPILSVDTEATWKHRDYIFCTLHIYTKVYYRQLKGYVLQYQISTLFSHYLTVALKFTSKDKVAVAQNKWICCFLDLSNPIQVLEKKEQLAGDDLEFLAIENERF